MAFQYAKAKSAAKRIDIRGKDMEKLVAKTMDIIAGIVGATLGPGGMPVLIERQEFNLPAMVTKDGVTVMRSLGFRDPTQHALLEAARDAAVRTASEAGDGTTTATVLAQAIVERLHAYCRENPKVSPQAVVRKLESTFKTVVEPLIKSLSVKADLSTPEGRKLLHGVARVSANGDTALADAVMDCFDLVGDAGNVTITESSGPSHYEVERISGFPVASGLEDCCMRFAPDFINDSGGQRCFMAKPAFLLYHGRISDFGALVGFMQKVAAAMLDPGETEYKHVNLVVVATGFGDNALTGLATNFKDPTTMNAFPLTAPVTAEPGAQLQFLLDLAALTGATILEPNSIPLEQAQLLHLGRGIEGFEAHRWRSNIIIGDPSELDDDKTVQLRQEREDRVLNRTAEVEQQLREAPSQFTAALIQERLAKLTGGIARLKVVGASNGELKEKRDRAEDAVCGVRGAIKHGCLPGGTWTLLRTVFELRKLRDPVLESTLVPALQEPMRVLMSNSGVIDADEQQGILEPMYKNICDCPSGASPHLVYDFLEGVHVDAFEAGVLDSAPAVLEAVRNALSIASLLGTLGGTVVFERDRDIELYEAKQNNDYLREVDDVLPNPADQRG